jgi:hypothetical protein
MKIKPSKPRCTKGAILAEACIGLALMALVWIFLSYSFFMQNNDVRTAMAARYAAWYQGANGNGTLATAGQMDQFFFFQPGLSTVTNLSPNTPVSALFKSIPGITSDGNPQNGPFMVKVSFGVSSITPSSTFPFNLMSTHLPMMPDSGITNVLTVSSTAQWDGVGDPWTQNTAQAWEMLALGAIASYFQSLL